MKSYKTVMEKRKHSAKLLCKTFKTDKTVCSTYPGDSLDWERSPTLRPGSYSGGGPGLGETLRGSRGRIARRIQGGWRWRLHRGVYRRLRLARRLPGAVGRFRIWHVRLAAVAWRRRRSSVGLEASGGRVVLCGGTGTR